MFNGADHKEVCAQQSEDLENFIKTHGIEEFGVRNDIRASGIAFAIMGSGSDGDTAKSAKIPGNIYEG